jgi:hypothetical protein
MRLTPGRRAVKRSRRPGVAVRTGHGVDEGLQQRLLHVIDDENLV